MDADLIQQLEHRYRVLGRSLGDGLDEASAWRQLGSRPPIGWHAAHLAEAMASTVEAVASGPGSCQLSPKLSACARRGGPPFHSMPLERLAGEVSNWSSSVLKALKSLPPADFDQPPLVEVAPAFRGSLTSRKVWLEGHLFHVTYHLGAIGLLRAEWAHRA